MSVTDVHFQPITENVDYGHKFACNDDCMIGFAVRTDNRTQSKKMYTEVF